MSSGASVHSVQFYDTHVALMDRLCALVSAGLLVGDSVLIVATEEHREQLVAALYSLNIDMLDYAWSSRIIMCDAEELLAEFMVDGLPDPELFRTAIGDLVDESKASESGNHAGVNRLRRDGGGALERGKPGGSACPRAFVEQLAGRTAAEPELRLSALPLCERRSWRTHDLPEPLPRCGRTRAPDCNQLKVRWTQRRTGARW
jgi:hypothetical protein